MAAAFHPIMSSLEAAKLSARPHLSLEDQLTDLANHLPENLPFPFSGVVAFRAGEGPIVQASHCPHQSEFTADQSFNVLSVGKLFTATAIMQLIEEGKFSLETPLNLLLSSDELDLVLRPPYLEEKPSPETLEGLKNHASEITIEHLITHRSGLYSSKTSPREGWDRDIIGEFHYSNYGGNCKTNKREGFFGDLRAER